MKRALTTLAALALTLSGCGGGNVADNVFHVGLQDDPKTLDPAVAYDVAGWALEHMLFETLVSYGPDSRIVPALATKWEAAADGKRYTFTLREGAKFHDGGAVTAADVVASFARVMDPATKSPGAAFYRDIVGADARLKGDAASKLGVSAPDARTVVIDLVRPNVIFLQLVAMPFGSVMPVSTKPGDPSRHPVGSGPFALDHWDAGQAIVFKRPPHLAPDPDALAGVQVSLGVSESLEVLKFERGELDVLGALRNIPAADFARLEADAAMAKRMMKAPDAAVHYVTLNTRFAPFDKRDVRLAIAKAIDKARVVQLVNGRGQVAAGILPPTTPGFDPDFRGIPRDVPGAKALLAKAGMAAGFEATYFCTTSDTQKKVAQSIQQDLAAIGIKLAIKAMAFPTYLEAKSTPGQVGIGAGNWSQDYPDPSNFLTTMFSSKNITPTASLNDSYYSNPEVDRLLDEAGASADPMTRARKFRAAEELIVADAPVVPLYYPVKVHLPAERVKDYRIHPVWGLDLAGVELAK